MHYRYANILQSIFYFKAPRGSYILKINAAKNRRDILYNVDYFIVILSLNAYRESINVRKLLKEYGFSFHYGYGCFSAYVSQSQHSASVAYNRNRIQLHGIPINIIRIHSYCPAYFRYSRGINQA